jgi:hypothetical protein
MIRLFSVALLSLLVVGEARAADDIAGTWRQELEGGGVSYWELTPRKGERSFTAQEYGLGGKKGVAHLEDEHLVIHWEDDAGKGTYKWRLKGTSGKGELTLTPKDGEKTVTKSSVRFVGK